jgi:NAD(P)-dependent dehydrogenase (short-subunit alcohol dehydrogenase family)
MKFILVTGASTGIGYSAVEHLIRSGYGVFGSVRKQEDASRLQSDFGDNFIPLIFDVTDEQAVLDSVETVKSKMGPGDQLISIVNNSGIALGGPIQFLPTDVYRKQFEVNLFGVVNVTRSYLKLLGAERGASHRGRVVMISSVSGKRSYPFVSPYTASKHALEAFSDSLRREMMLYGVKVVIIEPGPIKTPIWDKTPSVEDNPFLGTDYESSLRKFYGQMVTKGKHEGLPVDRVGKLIEKVITIKNPKTRYVITGRKWLDFILPGILPDRMLDKLFAKFLGIDREKL